VCPRQAQQVLRACSARKENIEDIATSVDRIKLIELVSYWLTATTGYRSALKQYRVYHWIQAVLSQ
jgi:hypothetical protein